MKIEEFSKIKVGSLVIYPDGHLCIILDIDKKGAVVAVNLTNDCYWFKTTLKRMMEFGCELLVE